MRVLKRFGGLSYTLKTCVLVCLDMIEAAREKADLGWNGYSRSIEGLVNSTIAPKTKAKLVKEMFGDEIGCVDPTLKLKFVKEIMLAPIAVCRVVFEILKQPWLLREATETVAALKGELLFDSKLLFDMAQGLGYDEAENRNGVWRNIVNKRKDAARKDKNDPDKKIIPFVKPSKRDVDVVLVRYINKMWKDKDGKPIQIVWSSLGWVIAVDGYLKKGKRLKTLIKALEILDSMMAWGIIDPVTHRQLTDITHPVEHLDQTKHEEKHAAARLVGAFSVLREDADDDDEVYTDKRGLSEKWEEEFVNIGCAYQALREVVTDPAIDGAPINGVAEFINDITQIALWVPFAYNIADMNMKDILVRDVFHGSEEDKENDNGEVKFGHSAKMGGAMPFVGVDPRYNAQRNPGVDRDGSKYITLVNPRLKEPSALLDLGVWLAQSMSNDNMHENIPGTLHMYDSRNTGDPMGRDVVWVSDHVGNGYILPDEITSKMGTKKIKRIKKNVLGEPIMEEAGRRWGEDKPNNLMPVYDDDGKVCGHVETNPMTYKQVFEVVDAPCIVGQKIKARWVYKIIHKIARDVDGNEIICNGKPVYMPDSDYVWMVIDGKFAEPFVDDVQGKCLAFQVHGDMEREIRQIYANQARTKVATMNQWYNEEKKQLSHQWDNLWKNIRFAERDESILLKAGPYNNRVYHPNVKGAVTHSLVKTNAKKHAWYQALLEWDRVRARAEKKLAQTFMWVYNERGDAVGMLEYTTVGISQKQFDDGMAIMRARAKEKEAEFQEQSEAEGFGSDEECNEDA